MLHFNGVIFGKIYDTFCVPVQATLNLAVDNVRKCDKDQPDSDSTHAKVQ